MNANTDNYTIAKPWGPEEPCMNCGKLESDHVGYNVECAHSTDENRVYFQTPWRRIA